MMTKKLYLNDAYTKKCDAVIQDVIRFESGLAIVLDQTIFYPEGGGQPSDTGWIDAVRIDEVRIEDHLIFHITTQNEIPLSPGDSVTCAIDFNRRFTLMQQHSGQHILSSVAEKLFDAHTVGFHIGDDYVTIDLNKRISEDELRLLEKEANRVVFSNLPIKAHHPDAHALRRMPLRKQPKVTDHIRVIEVETVDFSPCGGTHTAFTSEVGLIKIKRMEPYKTGVRLYFGCGQFALDQFVKRNDIVNALIQLFSSSEEDLVPFCQQLLANQKEDRKLLLSLKKQTLERSVEKLLSTYDDDLKEDIKVITLIETDESMNDLRTKVAMICEHDNFIVLGTSSEDEKRHVVLSRSKNLGSEYDMNQLFKTYMSPLGIRGGGNLFVAQGGGELKIDIDSGFDQILEHIKSVL
jgi:alanyl-tRNA synthetase